ncbi:hypothetical protein POTOM_007975 [Populus tomentosa]|uniref:PB1 domain-containing protein n=1 Tax=Populus tomentosa TaxID=118781 RepID=A0A8X8AG63_POPTO|nr:hypothetical protein POTOM_007975 [Populus tomentosa]
MYTFSHSSYPDSRDTEDIHSSDDPLSTYKVKLMCSDGGKIQPRLHDNQLAYIGGDTKILSVDHDVDALISVTSDEDLEHMMIEFDRLHRASAKAAKLRLFLFSLKSFFPSEVKSERQLFVDALDSPTVPEVLVKDVSAGSECGSEDRKLIGDASEAFKQQTLDLRLHFAETYGENDTGHVSSNGYPMSTYVGNKQPVYLLQAPALRPVPGQVGKGYYGVQRVVQEVYSHVQQPAAGSIQLQKTTKAGGLMQPKLGVAERGYLQGWQGGGVVNQDGEVADANANVMTPQNSRV